MSIFNLNKDVATFSAVAEEDMIPLKTYLKKFGAYDTPSYGMTWYPDNELFEGIKTYQRKNNLTVDGTMKREGETICSVNCTALIFIALIILIVPSVYALRKVKDNIKKANFAVVVPFFYI